MELNPIFEKAVAFVNNTNQHVFLTGKAGTGKTTFLKYIKENSHKRMVVLAPTGVAAINAGGSTIHSFFFLPFGTYIPTQKTVWGGGNVNVYNKQQLFAKAKISQVKRDIIMGLDTLVIDEISMVRADILDAIDALLRMVRRKPDVPFGGIQLVFIGDMFQLPPVVKDEDWEYLKEVYRSPFFFDALVMKEAEPVYIELKKIFRQSDEQFINILNNIRNNEVEQEDLEILNEKYLPYYIPDAHSGFITLTTHNYIADEINSTAMEQLMSEPIVFSAKIEGEFPQNSYPVEENMVLKVGAQIMFIKNDKGEERRYFNGKIGAISALDKANKKITVRFPDEEDELVISPEEWENIRYDFDKEADSIKEVTLGTFSQYPIRLAWAVTIHKSQGLTFDKAVIDAGKAFAAGQVYVALSRLRSLDGLVLKSKITPSAIMTDPLIIEFAENESDENALNNMLALSQQIFAEQSVAQAFSFENTYDQWLEFTKELAKRAIADKEIAGQFAVQQLEQLKTLEQTGLKFGQQLNVIVNDNAKDRYQKLNERVQAGAGWFLNTLQPVIEATETHIKDFRVKQKTKKYIKDVQLLMQLLQKQKIQIEQAAAVTMGLASNIGISNIIEEVNKMFAPVPVEEITGGNEIAEQSSKVPTRDISFELFKEGKSPEKIAEIRGMATSTIYGHLAQMVAEGRLPATDLIKKDVCQAIVTFLKSHEFVGFSELKTAMADAYSFNDLKIAKAQFDFENSNA